MMKNIYYKKQIFYHFLFSIGIISQIYSLNVLGQTANGLRLINLVGNVSLIDEKNDARNLHKGVFLPRDAKLMIGESSQITLLGPNSEQYHFSQSSAIEISPDKIVLQTGTVWIQAPTEGKPIQIETMNGLVNLKKGELVIDFHEKIKRTQVFVISGNATLSNIFMTEKKELLVSGEISYVQKDFQQGMPRRPVVIGKETLLAVLKKFRGISPGDDQFKSLLATLTDDEYSLTKNVALGNKSETLHGQRTIASKHDDLSQSEKMLNHEFNPESNYQSHQFDKSSENGMDGIIFIPKNFSAPKREYPLKSHGPRKNFPKREIASVNKWTNKSSLNLQQVENNTYNTTIVKIFYYPVGQQTNSINIIGNKVDKEELASSTITTPKPSNDPLIRKSTKNEAKREISSKKEKKKIKKFSKHIPTTVSKVNEVYAPGPNDVETPDYQLLLEELKKTTPQNNDVY